MNKLLGYLFTPIHYLFFGLVLCIFHPIQWISLKAGGLEAHKKSVDIMNLFLLGTYYILGSSIKFTNRFDLPGNRPIIFTANHQSMYDIPPLIWFLRKHHAKFISKIELTKGIPSISFNLKYGGGANIDRKDSKQAIAEILKLGERMKQNNWSAVIFPEGTRSRDGRIKQFAVGGVATLLKRCPNALIVPVAITGSWKFVRYGTFPLSFGEKMTWSVLEPIEYTGGPLEELMLKVEKQIRDEVEQTLI
ncbi:lysophospholipid acyltransferase family protein [Daejeonella lutea]|uniref:1-acyl-sn-glycerol-3-phosphate acyltransferase n=1 Tax=Daejeonella lutea TaxID=572036 RepID=A0A1T5D7W5_9SPHI|nr:lysophospholipid acyltransferase family protein [Daejeonella lutea]SKB67794.1 1-acyl-sn-glycerol-3-phosphate acyltransferase [Daejeonella lutea]